MFKSKWSICAHFSSKDVHCFFKWYKTVKSLWLIFGFDHICQIFEKLYAKNMKAHVLGPMHFISWIEAKYKPSTHQELCYLNFELTKWVQEKNCQNCLNDAIRSVEVAKWPQRNSLQLLCQWRGWKSTLSPSFITFSEREPFLRVFL